MFHAILLKLFCHILSNALQAVSSFFIIISSDLLADDDPYKRRSICHNLHYHKRSHPGCAQLQLPTHGSIHQLVVSSQHQ